jgi:hypothetical protein
MPEKYYFLMEAQFISSLPKKNKTFLALGSSHPATRLHQRAYRGCTMKTEKPLGRKNYGSIGHLPNSRLGLGDHCVTEGQARIATIKTRDKHDRVIVQEKLDGSNVGVGRLGDAIIALGRAGYRAESSPFEQHKKFASWANDNEKRFLDILDDGERIVGEWILQAHGTKYALRHEPFVAFDLMVGSERMPFGQFMDRVRHLFVVPAIIETNKPITVHEALRRLGEFGFHGALDPVKGAVWRVERHVKTSSSSSERKWKVDFLTKFVQPDKIDGKYFPEKEGGQAIWNTEDPRYAEYPVE